MPSPVSGLISDAASPASSTRPSGCRGRPVDSGSRWAFSPVASTPGSSRSSPASRPVAVDPAGDELAVADVGPPVAEREGPGVGRPALLGRQDHLDAVRAGRLRGVAADRDGQPVVGGSAPTPSARRTTDSAPSAPTTHPGREGAVDLDVRPGAPSPGGRRAGGTPRPRRAPRSAAGRRSTARGTTDAGRCIARSTVVPPGERSRSRGTAG